MKTSTPRAIRSESSFHGFDATHAVGDVTFRDVTLNGKPLADPDVVANPFVKDMRIEP